MKYFIDTEFIEGPQKRTFFGPTKPTIDLISIAIVDENGAEFYAISRDFNLKEAWNRWQPRTGQGHRNKHDFREYWIRDNVLRPIFDDLLAQYKRYYRTVPFSDEFTFRTMERLIRHFGFDNWAIANNIKNGFVLSKEPEFYGYYSSYDWVVFCWLFGTMMKLPKGYPMYCRDLKQMMDDEAAKIQGKGSHKEKLAFVKSHPNYPKQANEHNALADAHWNLELYKFLTSIP